MAYCAWEPRKSEVPFSKFSVWDGNKEKVERGALGVFNLEILTVGVPGFRNTLIRAVSPGSFLKLPPGLSYIAETSRVRLRADSRTPAKAPCRGRGRGDSRP